MNDADRRNWERIRRQFAPGLDPIDFPPGVREFAGPWKRDGWFVITLRGTDLPGFRDYRIDWVLRRPVGSFLDLVTTRFWDPEDEPPPRHHLVHLVDRRRIQAIPPDAVRELLADPDPGLLLRSTCPDRDWLPSFAADLRDLFGDIPAWGSTPDCWFERIACAIRIQATNLAAGRTLLLRDLQSGRDGGAMLRLGILTERETRLEDWFGVERILRTVEGAYLLLGNPSGNSAASLALLKRLPNGELRGTTPEEFQAVRPKAADAMCSGQRCPLAEVRDLLESTRIP